MSFQVWKHAKIKKNIRQFGFYLDWLNALFVMNCKYVSVLYSVYNDIDTYAQ